MNQFLPNIPYENLPVEVIRYLCEKGVRGMHEYGLMDEIEDAKVANLLKDFDLRAVCLYKAINGYKTKSFWKQYRNNPEAVMTLISVVNEAKVNAASMGGYSRGGLSFSAYQDIDPATIMSNPHIWDAVADASSQQTGYHDTFNHVFKVEDIISWYEEDPIRSCKTIATNKTMFADVVGVAVRGSSKSDTAKKIVGTAVGFLHLYGNDRLQFLADAHHGHFKSNPDFFDDIVRDVYTIMSKESDRMRKLRDDCSSADFGAAATRSRSSGWFRDYMAYLGESKPSMLLDLVKNAPPTIALVPVALRRNKDFRSLKRLFQLSGDA